MSLLSFVLALTAALTPSLARAADGSTSVVVREAGNVLAENSAYLGELVSVSAGIASASGFTDVGVHEANLVGYAWPEGGEDAYMRSEVVSVWNDLVQLVGGPVGSPASIRAIASIAMAGSFNGELGPKGAAATLDYSFEVRVDGTPTSMFLSSTYDGGGFQTSTQNGSFANGDLAGDFEIPYGETVHFQSRAEPFVSENAGLSIIAPIGIRFQIPPGSSLVSQTPGVVYETSAPEPCAAGAVLAALAALAALARRT